MDCFSCKCEGCGMKKIVPFFLSFLMCIFISVLHCIIDDKDYFYVSIMYLKKTMNY